MGARISQNRSRAARFARIAGSYALPVLILTALGRRFDLIAESALLPLISTGMALAVVAFAAALYAITDIWQSGDDGLGNALIGIVYSVPVLILFAASVYALAVYPQLNDISTDIVNPPEIRLSGTDWEPIEPPADDQRLLQQTAYPDITARFYPVTVGRVYEAAHLLIDQRGWSIVSQTGPNDFFQSATIHAVARTLIFRFVDHVVIRMVQEDAGTRVDIRSASSVGRHDLGQNARRIRQWLDSLDNALQGERSELQPTNR